MALLEVRGLHAAYGRVAALWDVTFEVPAGQMVALLGSNGAGKTTTLRAISGLLPAAAGTIVFDGQDVTSARSDQIVELGVVHVPEGRQLWPRMSVEENLHLGAYLPRARGQRRRSLDYVYTLFPRLAERRGQLAGTLSGGERQMCALARGLMGVPRLLMLDEPSLGLAPMLVTETFETLRRLGADGLTVLLVEQNAQQALEMSSTAYVLENGRIAVSGSTAELLNHERVRAAYLGF